MLFRFQMKASPSIDLSEFFENLMENYDSLEAIKKSSKSKVYDAVKRKKGL